MKKGWKKFVSLALALALVCSMAPLSLILAEDAAGSDDAAVTVTAAYGRVTADQVKVRKQASTSAVYWFKVDTGHVCEILDVRPKGDVTWYKVICENPNGNGRTYVGYIHGDFFKVMTAEEVLEWQTSAVSTPTPAPTVDEGIHGYIQLKLSSANLRSAPGGKVQAQWEKKGEIIAYYGSPLRLGEYVWFNVVYNGRSYYVRNDTVLTVDAAGTEVTMEPPVDYVSGSATPKPTTTTYGYGKMIKDGVNLRLQPAGEVIQQIDRGTIVKFISTKKPGNTTWYYVDYNNIRGYVREDCIELCHADGSTSGSSQDTNKPTEVIIYGYIRLTEPGVNHRAEPAGKVQQQLDKDLILPVVGAIEPNGKYDWYYVQAPDGSLGYVREDCLVICHADGTTEGATLSGAIPTATPAPSGGSSSSVYGYVQLTKDGVNLRKTMGGSVLTQLDRGTVWAMTGKVDSKNNVKWYPISAEGFTGYVRGDCAYQLSQTQVDSYLAGNGVPKETVKPESPKTSYLITTVAQVNLRTAASKDASAPYNVDLGTVMAYNYSTSSSGVTWYRVVYKNEELWVLGTCVAVMTQEEYDAWVAANPGNTPQPDVILGYVKTNIGDLNVRDAAGGTKILTKVAKDVVMPYIAEKEYARSRWWYNVITPDGTRGFIDKDFLTLVGSDGSALPENTPGTGSGSGQTATYETLRVGSTGEAVLKLTTELRVQGYYTGDVTSTYTTAVRDAVKAFQKAKGLSVDGVAGPVTQHKLYGTVSEEIGVGGLTMTIYPAEKIDWWTGGIQQLWAKGEDYKVYDVKTGIVWWAHRWSGGKHADVEPLTAADTARLCQMYGVSSSDQITPKKHWHRRPSLVTIDGHTYACSLYGVPHNEDGDTIDNNDMIGQVCIHFTNSRTHESDKLDTDHQNAVDYAWKNAPNGYLPYDD